MRRNPSAFIVPVDTYNERTKATSKDATEWRRGIGCLELQVFFRKRATNYKALLRKTICKDKASYAPLPPCSEFF